MQFDFFLSNSMSHCSGERANGHNEGHFRWEKVGIIVITQPAVNGESNSNTDLKREEKLENSDANPTFQEQHNCK